MKKKLNVKEKNRFNSDFTTVLTLSLVSNAKGLNKRDLQNIRSCIREKRYSRVLRIIGKRYSMNEWKDYVEAQAAPLLRAYS